MKYEYAVKGAAVPEVEETEKITIYLEESKSNLPKDFNLILQKKDGTKRIVLGLRSTDKGLVAIRWTHSIGASYLAGAGTEPESWCAPDTFGVARDSMGRIVDLFKRDK